MNEHDVDSLVIWQRKVVEIFLEVKSELKQKFNIVLNIPNFEISPELNSSLGEWNSKRRTIRLAEKLFFTQPFSVISTILKHEIAHQIVTEVYKINIVGVSHGKAFANACKMLNIDSSTTLNEKEWQGTSHIDPVVNKIRKIIDKAHCTAASEKEAEIFLQKAQALMVKYNLSQCHVDSEQRSFMRRPVGCLYKKMPSYIFDICRLLEDHYFVRYIKTYIPIEDQLSAITARRFDYYIELFGEPSNIEIASYIYAVLMAQCDNLWLDFKKIIKKRGESIRGQYSRGSYIRGVIAGYQNKLDQQKNTLADTSTEYHALIHTGDPLLKEMYHQEYPSLRKTTTRYKQDSGYDHGFEQGQNLSISKPLGQAKNGNKLLNS